MSYWIDSLALMRPDFLSTRMCLQIERNRPVGSEAERVQGAATADAPQLLAKIK
jgi:hypothetical protein